MPGIEGFGDRLKQAHRRLEYLYARDIVQDEVAAVVGRTQATVARWFAGTVPDAAMVYLLCRLYGVRLPWLIEGDGDMESEDAPEFPREPPENGDPPPLRAAEPERPRDVPTPEDRQRQRDDAAQPKRKPRAG